MSRNICKDITWSTPPALRGGAIKTAAGHINPCEPWLELCSAEKVSYEYFGCDCSSIERYYQVLNTSKEWEDVRNCPFCGASINEFLYWNHDGFTHPAVCSLDDGYRGDGVHPGWKNPCKGIVLPSPDHLPRLNVIHDESGKEGESAIEKLEQIKKLLAEVDLGETSEDGSYDAWRRNSRAFEDIREIVEKE
jgi:hypothetical protein